MITKNTGTDTNPTSLQLFTAGKHIITFLQKYFQKELFWHFSCKGHSHGTHSNLSQTNQI